MMIIKRIYDSLLSPSKLNNYINDKKIITILYFLILLIIYSVPICIGSLYSSTLSNSFMKDIRTSFVTSEVIPFEVKNNKLEFNGYIEKNYYYVSTSSYNIYFSSLKEIPTNEQNNSIFSTKTNVLFTTDGLYAGNNKILTLVFSYADLDFDGIDFSKAKDNDYKYWENIFSKIAKVIEKQSNTNTWLSIVTIICIELIGLVFCSLIISVIGKLSGNKLKFTKYWQMSIYLITPMVFGYLFANLYSLQIFYYIGLIVTVMNSMTFNRLSGKGE